MRSFRRGSPGLFTRRATTNRVRQLTAMIAVSLLFLFAATLGVRAALQATSTASQQLAGWLPQGALLTIESRDFAGLLKRWNDSPEKSAWLKSDNFSVFSRSRLFGRLGDAQNEFAQSAGLPPDTAFLNEIAGSESVFAWYDIGKLEFLYITRMPAGSAEKTRLVQMHGKFSTRQVGSRTFYVRTQADPNQSSEARTVAFATSGDWLLLATREDLIAGALTLMDAKAANANSLALEPWFADAQGAAAKPPAELRMTLNLEKIVPTPYFRSYWVQRNITEMKQYRSAVADLYMHAGDFREERVLLPKATQDSTSQDNAPADLSALTALLPQHSGVYRAVVSPGVNAAMDAIDEKLLTRRTGSFADMRIAPDADVAVHGAGSTGDLEMRIDAAPIVILAQGAEAGSLRQAMAAANLQAMMTVSRTGSTEAGLWVPFESAVVLSAAEDWNTPSLQSALQQTVASQLTASGLGLEWKPVKTAAGSYFELNETRPLELAVSGKICILADNPGLMREMLERLSKNSHDGATSQATLLAGFQLQPERSAFARWSALVDRTNSVKANQSGDENGDGHQPSFFSQDMRSLGDAFAALASERVEERKDGALTRQTVTYTWQH